MKHSQYISFVLIFHIIVVSEQRGRGCGGGFSIDPLTGVCRCPSTKYIDSRGLCTNCEYHKRCDGSTQIYDCDVGKRCIGGVMIDCIDGKKCVHGSQLACDEGYKCSNGTQFDCDTLKACSGGFQMDCASGESCVDGIQVTNPPPTNNCPVGYVDSIAGCVCGPTNHINEN